MRTRRRTQRRSTWRWCPRPRPRPDTPVTENAEAATTAEDRDEYTTGQLTWLLGELGFTTPRRPRHGDCATYWLTPTTDARRDTDAIADDYRSAGCLDSDLANPGAADGAVSPVARAA